MIDLLLHYLILFWALCGLITFILYKIDAYVWSKEAILTSNRNDVHGSGSVIMYIPLLAGGPIALILLIMDLIKKGGFGAGKIPRKNK